MSVSAITSNSASTSATTADTSSQLPVQTLDENDFLQLLVTQMTSQDPLNPESNTDFIAQMAQFTTLQQTQNLETTVSQVSASQQFSQAAALLGQTVQVQTSAGGTDQGVVTGLQMSSGAPQLVVNSQTYDLSQVLSVTPTATNQ